MTMSRRQFVIGALSTGAAAVTAGGIAGAARALADPSSQNGRYSSGGYPTVLDFSARFIDPKLIAADGHLGVIGYVSLSRPGANFGAKPLTREYVNALHDAGLKVASVYQYGKPGDPTPSDFTRGYEGGLKDAEKAAEVHATIGGPDSAPIFFAVDQDVTAAQREELVRPWLEGIAEIIGTERTGVYGGAPVCEWASEAGLVGAARRPDTGLSNRPGTTWCWQTRAWSRGVVDPHAVLYQNRFSHDKPPSPTYQGVDTDVSDVLCPDWGQW